MSKLISFSLYGDTSVYQSGAIKNAVLARTIYPGWTCRFYVSQEIPLSVIQKLKSEKAEIVPMVRRGNIDGMFWRFLPVSEEKWDAVIVRDVDSPLCGREALAVDEWLNSNKAFHIMRDHPAHAAPVLGGMWGAKRGMIRNMESRIKKWEKRLGTNAFDKSMDQVFLFGELYPLMKDNAMIHSDLIRYNDEGLTPFPSPRKGGEFVGQYFTDGDETCAERTIELFKKTRLARYRVHCRHSFNSFMKKIRDLPAKLKRFEKQSILLYHGIFFSYPASNYPLIHDKAMFMRAKCVVFHIPNLTRRDFKLLPVLHAVKPRSQVWVAFSQESAEIYPILNNDSFMKLFDVEMSYRKKADIWTPYLRRQLPLLRKTVLEPKTKFCAAFISSPYNQSKRLQILSRLMRYIRVDSYGKIFQTHRLNDDKGYKTKHDIITQYKFTIAFENSIGVDYVTEKLYQPLIAGSIPVYLGAPNVDDFSPGDNAYLNVSDFKNVRELAEFMKSADISAFHEWRNRPIRKTFNWYSQVTEKEPFDRLGDLVFNARTGQEMNR
jgi:hypothetical protein